METCKLLRSTHPTYSTSPLKMTRLTAAGTDHGGVKRSIGEIVDTDEPSIPRKKKYAKEAWPGAAKFCQVKKKQSNYSTI